MTGHGGKRGDRKRRQDARASALVWLQTFAQKCEHYASIIDPDRRRDYGRDPVLRALDGIASQAARALATVKTTKRGGRLLKSIADCTCYHTCADNPATACSLSGGFHVHAGEPCPEHPDAPGDL